MARKISVDIGFDEAEDEVLFTIAALKADPDAQDLAPITDSWLGLIDAARTKGREARQVLAETDAARVVANARLDQHCKDFADDLYLAVGKDRKATRWLQFFAVAASVFVRQALEAQLSTVKGWLAVSTDETLEEHREPLKTWADACDAAIVKTRGSALVRGQAWQAREEMAESLTRERDGLQETLAARARERKLPREWPRLFFRVTRRGSRARDIEPPPVPAEE